MHKFPKNIDLKPIIDKLSNRFDIAYITSLANTAEEIFNNENISYNVQIDYSGERELVLSNNITEYDVQTKKTTTYPIKVKILLGQSVEMTAQIYKEKTILELCRNIINNKVDAVASREELDEVIIKTN